MNTLMRRCFVSVVLILLLLTTATSATTSRAAFAGRNGRIAFSSYREGQLDIFTMQPDGGSLRNLTEDPEPDFQPAWSADGSRIAFVSLHTDDSNFDQIYVMDPRGGARTRITDFEEGNPQEPAWSPDGERLAFHVSFGGAIDDEIFTMNPDGSDLVQITENEVSDSNPAWAPDGRQLAFVRGGRIMTMDPDGTNVHPVEPGGTLGFDPAWSPSGRRIAFVSPDEHFSQFDLFTMRLDGSGLRRLSDTRKTESSPSWSPDGHRIAYVRTHVREEQDTREDLILTMWADGSHRRILSTDAATRDSTPDWRTLN